MERLKGKVAIVTGAGAGIGKSIAEVFAREGAKVVVATRREINGQPVADKIVEDGGHATFSKCDISDEDDVKNMITSTIKIFGKIDILVNNAGIFSAVPIEEMNMDEWDKLMNIDLRGTFMCMLYSIPKMLESGGGSIINISSNHSVACYPGSAHYGAAKWAIVGLSKALAVELADRNVRINVLSPGLIDTPMWHDVQASAPDAEKSLNYWKSNIPMGRVGKPEEIAYTAVFLATDEAGYITGSNLLADGGVTSLLVSKPPFKYEKIVSKNRK